MSDNVKAPSDSKMSVNEIRQIVREFVDERDWRQFHSPKNIAMALSVEASELLEHFQWLTESQSASPESVNRDEVATEIADVQIYLAMLADKLDIDIEKAVEEKIEANGIKYSPSPTSAKQP